jgi:hypothetical protein
MTALTVIPPPAPSFGMGDMETMALAIARGGLFGSKDPNAVLTLCLLAQAEGKHPALIMQDFHIIQGKPAKKADAMLRDFLSGGGKVEWHTLTNECADATFSHPAGGSARIDWTMARAKAAGLATAMWTKFPRQMLRSRVISEGVRTIYPGATSGLYVPEEVSEFEQRAEASQERAEPPIEHGADDGAAPASQGRQRPAPLTGPIMKRADARVKYGEIVRELNACEDDDALCAYLETEKEVIEQFERELPLGWNGDGADYIGLRAEIEAAKVRCMDPAAAEMRSYVEAG